MTELAGVVQELRQEIRELRGESRAHMRAIFALIDRIEGGGASPAT